MGQGMFSKIEKQQKRWVDIKSDPEKLEKAKELSRKFYLKHRDSILASQRKDRKAMRELSLELGNCTACHKPKTGKYRNCIQCREKHRIYQRRRNERLQQQKESKQ